jgi:hypothetical protein
LRARPSDLLTFEATFCVHCRYGPVTRNLPKGDLVSHDPIPTSHMSVHCDAPNSSLRAKRAMTRSTRRGNCWPGRLFALVNLNVARFTMETVAGGVESLRASG